MSYVSIIWSQAAITRVTIEIEGLRLENHTYGANICACYRQGVEEVMQKNVVDQDGRGEVVEVHQHDSPPSSELFVLHHFPLQSEGLGKRSIFLCHKKRFL